MLLVYLNSSEEYGKEGLFAWIDCPVLAVIKFLSNQQQQPP